MTRTRFVLLAAALAAAGALSGCADNFQASVTRFHAEIPPPEQGATFTIKAEDPRNDNSLEFAHYADLVSERLTTLGYARAADPASAKLVVRLGYDVDKGHDRVVSSGFRRPFYGPTLVPVFYSTRRGTVVRYVYGYDDPFLWGGYGYPDVDSYTVYVSQLKLRIDKADGGRVFEGTASAQSLSNKLTYLVPNLVDAIFQGFPGKDGEQVKVTIPPEGQGKK
jgi:hypothetical protein